MENVNTSLEEIFKTLFPTDGLEPEGFCIDARKLHQALESRQDFSTWIKSRIKRLRLIEGFDYQVEQTRSGTVPLKNGTDAVRVREGVRVAIDYSLTLHTAKEISMMESTDAGYRVRCYFIECEKALRTLEPELTEEIQQKVLGYNQFLDSSNTYSMAEAAQLLGTGRTRLMKDLRDKSYLKANNTPYQKVVESGYMITKLVPTRVGVITVARVTTKGLAESLTRLQRPALAEPLVRLQRLALDHLRQKL